MGSLGGVEDGEGPACGSVANIEVRRNGPARLTEDLDISSGCIVERRGGEDAVGGGGVFMLNFANELLILLEIKTKKR